MTIASTTPPGHGVGLGPTASDRWRRASPTHGRVRTATCAGVARGRRRAARARRGGRRAGRGRRAAPPGAATAGGARRSLVLDGGGHDRGRLLGGLGDRRLADLVGPVAGDLVARPARRTGRSGGSTVDAVLGVAEPLAQPAAGVEPAARRRRGRRRHVALEHEALLAAPRVRVGDRRQERDRVRVARVRGTAARRCPTSTILPRYMTPTRSQKYWTTDRLWLMNR